MAAASASRERLFSTTSCSTIAVRSCEASLLLASPDQRRAADLVEDRRHALLVRRVDDVCFERVDGRQFLRAPAETQLAGLMGPRDRRAAAASMVASCAITARRASGAEPSPAAFAALSTARLSDTYAAPVAVAEVQRVVVRLAEKEVAAVSAPPRRIRRRRYFSRFVYCAQAPGHARSRPVLSVSVSSSWLFSTAVTALRAVVVGSCHHELCRCWLNRQEDDADDDNPTIVRIAVLLPSRLAPRAEVLGRSAHDALAGRTSVPHAAEAHVHRRGFGVALTLAPRQQLLEDVRQHLVRGHVLAAAEQFAGGDLVQNRRDLVDTRGPCW